MLSHAAKRNQNLEHNFLPAVQAKIGQAITTANFTDPMAYGYVTANALNIRKGPSSSHTKLGVTTLGSIMRIYLKKGRWYKISKSIMAVFRFGNH